MSDVEFEFEHPPTSSQQPSCFVIHGQDLSESFMFRQDRAASLLKTRAQKRDVLSSCLTFIVSCDRSLLLIIECPELVANRAASFNTFLANLHIRSARRRR